MQHVLWTYSDPKVYLLHFVIDPSPLEAFFLIEVWLLIRFNCFVAAIAMA